MNMTNQNRFSGQTGFLLMLVLLVATFILLPLAATAICPASCDSELINEIHTLQPGMDSTELPDPIADFCLCEDRGCEGTEIYFVDYSQGVIQVWNWNFGDPASGANNLSSLENPTHIYNTPGLYTVTLTVSGYGNSDTITREQIITIDTKPTADFIVTPNAGCTSTLFHFEDRSTGATSWLWDFGDGTTSTDQNPTHTYAATGHYTVMLMVQNDCGKDWTWSELEVIVVDGPTAIFDYEMGSRCEGASVSFYDRSIFATAWLWDFGDGTTSTEQNPAHTYAVAGSYAIRLTVSNDCGEDDTTETIEVLLVDPPVADFSTSQTEVCPGGTVTFTDLSTNATSWNWDFGDGSHSTEQNPTHTFNHDGLWTVTLYVSNECGSDTEIKTELITVLREPVAEFRTIQDGSCIGATATFVNLSSNVVSSLWDFGDGTTSTEQHPTHQYTSAGVYTVSLTATNSCGDDTETKDEHVTIDGPPIADFGVSNRITCISFPVIFTDLSSGASTWYWDFGDGTTSQLQNPTHAYSAEGSYTVSLYVTNECGDDTELREQYITVYEGPQADFSSSLTEFCVGGLVDFTDLSVGATSWQWTFGDGTTSNDQNPSHLYTTAGLYSVSLTVAGPCGEDQVTKHEYINVIPGPTADFIALNPRACTAEPVQFEDRSTAAVSWLWDFGDGQTSTDQNPQHTYAAPELYTVRLVVTNECGEDSEVKEQYITIGSGPVADFRSFNQEWCVGMPVDFEDISIDADSWFWEFGDGTTSTQQHPSHAYQTDGLFTVSLTVTNQCGDDTETRVNYILIHPFPTAEFTADLTDLCVGDIVTFTDQSNEADRWNWNFGDGGTSIEQSPTHRYTVAGTYDVTLTVNNGCGDDPETKRAYITVNPDPIADYTSNTREACVYEDIQFTDLSQYATTWVWDFGDGTTSTDRNPTHQYSATGNYYVSLTVTNDCYGDSEFRSEYITILEGPTAGFTADQTDICEGATVQFTNSSTNATSWSWSFGDGGISQSEHPSHTYNTPGTYMVQMVAYNSCGDDVAIRNSYITVRPKPLADFSIYDGIKCINRPVMFSNLSTNADSYLWYFGDGSSSTEEHPSHTYTSTGSFTITLIATNACGADTTVYNNAIYIEPVPTADFTADNPQTCVGQPVTFTNHSTDADNVFWTFGDGGDSYDYNPSHSYMATGVYTVSMWAYNQCGYDSLIREAYITVGEYPLAGFMADKYETCVGGTVSFTDQSLRADSWLWDFGDGNTSPAQHPSHSYVNAGIYQVYLTVTNDCGSNTGPEPLTIFVKPVPTADFSYESAGECGPKTVTFTNLSDVGDSWLWDFGDGTTSTSENPVHDYAISGTYDVTLTATNACGTDSITKQVPIVIQTAPIAEFTANTTHICTGGSVQFTDQSTGAMSWDWDFGDGLKDKVRNPLHTFTAPGSYTITLTVQGECGSDTETKELYITVAPGPIADFTADQTDGCANLMVTFTDLSTGAMTWLWDFGDGQTTTSQNPSHTFANPGSYDVRLTVTNECGSDFEEKIAYITVYENPIADFGLEVAEVCIGETVWFFDNSTGAMTWLWDFGDGTGSSEQYPEHIYDSAGSYTVSLTVTNACGDDTERKVDFVTVYGGPTADFSATPVSGRPTMSVTFTDLSITSQTIWSWDWDFGDGTSSTQQHPTHDYTKTGTYTVTLIVTDACGPDTAIKYEYIFVDDSCTVDFIAEPTEGCAPLTVWFGGVPTGDCNITSWLWDFGDPASGNDNSATTQDAQHIFTTSGDYTVTLTAVSNNDTMIVAKTDFITVYGGPTALFDVTPTSGTAPLACSFADRSSSSNGVTTWLWDFGDPSSGSANSSTLQNPSHTYVNNGSYTATLIASDYCGSDTISQTITVAATLEIIKAVNKPFAVAGDDLTYTVTLRNNGTEVLGAILMTDTIPDMSSYVAASLTGNGTYIPHSDLIAWAIPALNPGAEKIVTFKVALDGPFPQFPAVVSNYAVASTGIDYAAKLTPQVYISNIVETIVDIPLGPPSIDKAVNRSLANPGDTLTYSITVSNNQPAPASGLKVYDAPPAYTTFLGGITGGGIYDPAADSLFWDLGTLAMFSDTTVSFQVTVDSDAPSGLEIPNSALYVTDFLGGDQSDTVITIVHLEPIFITKTVSRPSGMIGDLVKFTIKIQNFSDQLFSNLIVLDTMPVGITYVNGTSSLDGASVADPTGANPISWMLGDLPAKTTVTLEYASLISPSARPGLHDNIARAEALQNGNLTRSNRALAQIYIVSYTISGTIRGRVIIDCDGDGIPDMDNVPTGIDIYLDDGSHSQVNDTGMFYFSTVRPGERVVALDERDLGDFFVPEGAQASVFVHVHESGESYVLFRICPDYPSLDIIKKASIIPTVKVTKRAAINPEPVMDSLGVLIDYQIDIKSNGLADPTKVRVIDSFPENMNLIILESNALAPSQSNNELVYEITAAEEQLQESVYYSLKDMVPGVRRFLTNRVYLEGDPANSAGPSGPLVSEPAEVAAGPFLLAPPQDVMITLTPALFITSKAFLQPPAFPLLKAVADSINKYADAEITVEGHTDLRIIHTEEFPSNWELGEARAKAVADWLIDSAGISGDRMTYESFAATRPVITDVPINSIALQPNRRTEVIIKAGVRGFLAPEAQGTDNWVSSTSLALSPNRFDTLFEAIENPVAIELDDSWEVILTVVNQSDIGAEVSSLTDILPAGTEFLSGSATLDGLPITAIAVGERLSLELKQIKPSQTLELRYRIRTLDGQQPSGGGAASIEIMSSSNLPVVQTSNEVTFK